MSQETLDLRRSIQIIRRHKLLMGIMVALGILAGGAYAVLKPPMLTSTALVLLPQSGQAAQAGAAAAANGGPNPWTETQQVIAKSNPVLSGALPHVRPAMSIDQLRSEVQIGSQTPYIISVSAEQRSPPMRRQPPMPSPRAISPISAPRAIRAARFRPSCCSRRQMRTGPGLLKRIVDLFALLGAIFGALIGAIIALAISRSDRRLRERDEIANSIGVPVLASFPVGHPSNPGEWTRLLKDYKPGALHALQLRKALQQLEMAAGVNFGKGMAGGHSPSCLFPPILEPSPSVPSWRPLPRPKGSPLPWSSHLSKARRSRPRCKPPAPRRPHHRNGRDTCRY